MNRRSDHPINQLLPVLLGELQALDMLESIKPRWFESVASFPDGVPDCLQPEQISTSLQWAGFAADIEPMLVSAAGKIVSNDDLQYLAWHYCRMIYEYDANAMPLQFVPLEKMLGEDGPLFYLLIALAFVPRLRRHHLMLGIPEHVTRETCLQVKCFCDNYRQAHGGRAGVFPQIAWFRNYLNGSIYVRLGRFEYCMGTFLGDFRVYRNRVTGQTLALAGPAWEIDSSGWMEGVKTEMYTDSCWQTVLKQSDSSTYGFPVAPQGCVQRDPVVLTETDWACVLEKGTPVLHMHIPAGGGMSMEKCAASLREADRFFGRYFPAPAVRSVVCSSWMFSPILEQILPSDANLTRFMRELYLCPAENLCGNDALWFVFLQKHVDPATAPRETSLQRAILSYLETGKTWHNGTMFFMLDDLERFGSQWYRRQGGGNFRENPPHPITR